MQKPLVRVATFALAIVMLIGILPMTALAAISNWAENNVIFDGTSFGTNGYYNVISKKDYVLVPGAAVESEIVNKDKCNMYNTNTTMYSSRIARRSFLAINGKR